MDAQELRYLPLINLCYTDGQEYFEQTPCPAQRERLAEGKITCVPLNDNT